MYEIISDMSLDIDRETAEKCDIKYIPMEVVLGDNRFIVTKPASFNDMHEYYEKLRKRVPTKTSQVTPYNFTEIFEPYIKEGKEILCITLASALSKTYENALLSVKDLKDKYKEKASIEIVDSFGGTGGMGLMCHLAGMWRDAGLGLREAAVLLRKEAPRLCYSFKVRDLMYLVHGGRVSSAKGILGTALNLRPVLNIKPDGSLETIKSTLRGDKMALRYMVKRYEETRLKDNSEGLLPEGMENLVYISSADCMTEAESLKAMVLEANPKAEVVITSVCHVIGAHVGADMLALIYPGIPSCRTMI